MPVTPAPAQTKAPSTVKAAPPASAPEPTTPAPVITKVAAPPERMRAEPPAPVITRTVTPQSMPPIPVARPEAKPAPELSASVEDLIRGLDASQDSALNTEHKGVDWTRTVEALPEDARKLLGNLRADYTRKTQELAIERKKLDGERKAFTNSDSYRKLQELSAAAGVEYDPYDPASFVAAIRQEVAKQVIEAFKPVAEEQALSEHRAKLESFKASHPDINDKVMAKAVAEELKANDHINLEQAYWIVKGRRLTEENERTNKELSAYQKAAAAAGLRVSTGTRTQNKRPPASLTSAVEIQRWLRAQQQE